MKKLVNLFILFITFIFITPAFASGAAKIRMNIQGAHGQYFLCFVNSGCLSIQNGKTYNIYHRVDLSNLSIVRKFDHLVAPQPAASSCNVLVQKNQTGIISGSISGGRNFSVRGLRCSVR